MKKNKYIGIITLLVLALADNAIAQFAIISGSDWNTAGTPGVNHMTIGTSSSNPSA